MTNHLRARVQTAWLAAGALAFVTALNAAELPDRVLPAGVGVNIHFSRGHERDLDLIAAAGFKFIRMDFVWGEIERQKGAYNWSAYDELTANLDRRGLRAYYILDYSNPLYEETVVAKNPISGVEQKSLASPQHPGSVAAFARWAAAAAEHFHGRHVVWEIWNEPNITFWQPKPDVRQYTALALATLKAVRAADPQATIVAPAASGFAWPFLESFLQSGALDYLDGVSVHPYRPASRPPETAAKDFQTLRALIETNAPPARKNSIPIISGEWGYSSNVKGVSPATQAAFIARQQLANLWNGLPISIWYDWKNDGPDPNENEHNFGTVTPDLTPKPAYLAIKTLTHELAGFRVASRHDAGSPDDFVLIMTNAAGATKLAAWTLKEPHALALPLQPAAAQEISIVNGEGQETKIEIKAGQFMLPLTSAPQYVTLDQMRLN
jgi:polysaccharide biosynthesis protein PslG